MLDPLYLTFLIIATPVALVTCFLAIVIWRFFFYSVSFPFARERPEDDVYLPQCFASGATSNGGAMEVNGCYNCPYLHSCAARDALSKLDKSNKS